MKSFMTALCLLVLFSSCSSVQQDTEYQEVGFQDAKIQNVFLFIGDGMGFNSVLATEYWNGHRQVYEAWDIQLAMSTYSSNGRYNPEVIWASPQNALRNPTDSAAAATAMATGEKTYGGAVGYSLGREELRSVLYDAEDCGMSTGVVTSVTLAHATPASFAAHNQDRGEYQEIAYEMIMESPVDVIMGCGHPDYYWDSDLDALVYNPSLVGGDEVWQGLLNGSIGNDADKDGQIDRWTLISDREDFRNMAQGETPHRLIGVPNTGSTLQLYRDAIWEQDKNQEDLLPYEVPLDESVPTLAEMTTAAINVLDNNQRGFFLMVEGGAIDWANHGNYKGHLIEEMNQFNAAVEAAVSWIESNSNWEESLIIVTADHETGFIWGSDSEFDGILANEPGELAEFEYYSEDHSNLLVPFYAKGFASEDFRDRATHTDPVYGPYMDNTDIAHELRYLFSE